MLIPYFVLSTLFWTRDLICILHRCLCRPQLRSIHPFTHTPALFTSQSMSPKLSRILPTRFQLLAPRGRLLHLSRPRWTPRTVEEEDKEDYYSQLLSAPLPTAASAVRKTPSSTNTALSANTSSPANPTAASSRPEPRVIFGSRLVGPAVRRQEGWARERPEEPDNCCMSGCVNCVWDAYREEVEAWAARRRQREGESADARGVGERDEAQTVSRGEELFQGVPVGIREFMALEKRLKEREGAGRVGDG